MGPNTGQLIQTVQHHCLSRCGHTGEHYWILLDSAERIESLQCKGNRRSNGSPPPKGLHVGNLPTGTRGGRAISRLVTFVSTMTVHVLERKTDPMLTVWYFTLGVGPEFRVDFGLDGARSDSCCKVGIKKKRVRFGCIKDVQPSSEEFESFDDGSQFSSVCWSAAKKRN